MDDYWLERAHKYIREHRAFRNVGEICVGAAGSSTISAELFVGLPARFLDAGVTESGVRSVEPVKFAFSPEFPLKAPTVILRDDFPRSFPHINPSRKEVSPCIYEGDLSELLQQSEWMNGVLNQLVDWMEKAASGSLIDYGQGWEPMRNDTYEGYIAYDVYELLRFVRDASFGSARVSYEERNGTVAAGFPHRVQKGRPAVCVVCRHPNTTVQATYAPNTILKLSDLYAFARSLDIVNLKEIIEKYDSQYLNEEKMFVALAIHRPCKIINSDTNVEILNFVIDKARPRGGKKRVLPECSVKMLAHINETSPQLLSKMSGTKQSANGMQSIALIGCGSLGSKIGLHLARSGNGPFLCVDDDILLPHNYARHGLSFFIWNARKADQLALSVFSISGQHSEVSAKEASKSDYSKSRIIIDTTASLAVRSYLMANKSLPPVISHLIYGGGTLGVSLIESSKKNVSLSDLWGELYFLCLEKEWLREIIFSEQKESVSVGQGCGSYTVVMKDATLSLFAAAMSLIDQNVLETSLPNDGHIVLARIHGDTDLSSERIEVKAANDVPSATKKSWDVRVLDRVLKKMEQQSQAAGRNETGGCLIGSVFDVPRSIIITDILPPPPDSVSTPKVFILGTEGLEARIKVIEKRTNGKVTYLGTWHSHPCGGGPSGTDEKTAMRLVFVRNYEPTVCLIWTPEGVVQI